MKTNQAAPFLEWLAPRWSFGDRFLPRVDRRETFYVPEILREERHQTPAGHNHFPLTRLTTLPNEVGKTVCNASLNLRGTLSLKLTGHQEPEYSLVVSPVAVFQGQRSWSG